MTEHTQSEGARSIDLLRELRNEQATFKLFVRALAILLIVAAVIVLSSVGYFWLQLSSNSKNLTADFKALQAVSAGLAGQERESMNADNIRLRENLHAAGGDAHFVGIAQSIIDEQSALAQKGVAVDLAKAHFAGDLLNNSTIQVLREMLRVDTEMGAAILSETERLLMESAIGVSGESQFEELQTELLKLAPRTETVPIAGMMGMRSKEKQALVTKLKSLTRNDRDEIEGIGYAGLAMLYYRYANAGSTEWDGLCENVDKYTQDASDAGFRPPHLMLYRGECLRKNGQTAAAHREFSNALSALDSPVAEGAFDPGIVPEYRQLAHHGVGTTKLALIAEREWSPEVDGELQAEISTAQRQLDIAARIRQLRGATDVGVVYSTENIGFIYLYRGAWETEDPNPHWQEALDHTGEVDAAVAISWNLAIRYIAAKQQELMLMDVAETDYADVREVRAIMDTAARTFRQMPCDTVDLPELLKLMPAVFRDDIERLAKHCAAN